MVLIMRLGSAGSPASRFWLHDQDVLTVQKTSRSGATLPDIALRRYGNYSHIYLAYVCNVFY